MRNSKQKRLEWKKIISGDGIIKRYYRRQDLIDAIFDLVMIHLIVAGNKLRRKGDIKRSVLNIFHLCNINYPVITKYYTNDMKTTILMKVEQFIYWHGDKYETANKLLKYLNAKLKGVDISIYSDYNKSIHQAYINYSYSQKIFKLKKRLVKKVFNISYWHILRLF